MLAKIICQFQTSFNVSDVGRLTFNHFCTLRTLTRDIKKKLKETHAVISFPEPPGLAFVYFTLVFSSLSYRCNGEMLTSCNVILVYAPSLTPSLQHCEKNQHADCWLGLKSIWKNGTFTHEDNSTVQRM